MQWVISGLLALLGLTIGVVGAVASFRGDVRVLDAKFESWKAQLHAERTADRLLLDEQLKGIGNRVNDIARMLNVKRRTGDDGIEL